jgi:hypothetical protein
MGSWRWDAGDWRREAGRHISVGVPSRWCSCLRCTLCITLRRHGAARHDDRIVALRTSGGLLLAKSYPNSSHHACMHTFSHPYALPSRRGRRALMA